MVSGLIGVVHLPAMPGDPTFAGSDRFNGVLSHALRDAAALAEGGVDGMIVENFGSLPFGKRDLPPHQVAAIALIAARCKSEFELPVGVNCLRNDARSALGIAAAAELAFVRVNVHTGAYITDQGLVEGRADQTLRYRASLGADDVAICADVLVKHAAPLGPVDLAQTAADCAQRGLADGLIVTGTSTGATVKKRELETVRDAVGEHPLLLGSGVTPTHARTLAPLANGAIVGTWLKRDAQVRAPVDRERVRKLAAALRPSFRALPGA